MMVCVCTAIVWSCIHNNKNLYRLLLFLFIEWFNDISMTLILPRLYNAFLIEIASNKELMVEGNQRDWSGWRKWGWLLKGWKPCYTVSTRTTIGSTAPPCFTPIQNNIKALYPSLHWLAKSFWQRLLGLFLHTLAFLSIKTKQTVNNEYIIDW